MASAPWRIELFGGLRACQGDHTITRFSTQKTASLLARLAYYRSQNHSREELIELLWPGVQEHLGRQSLRQALTTLRHFLEPAG